MGLKVTAAESTNRVETLIFDTIQWFPFKNCHSNDIDIKFEIINNRKLFEHFYKL